MMKKRRIKKRFIFYVCLGLGYLGFWVLHDFIDQSDHFGSRMINNAWLAAYLTVINYILFEYTVPFFKFNWRLILAPIFFIAHFLCYSLGLYAWRFIGIKLNIYTEIRVHPSIEEGTTYHLPYALMSVIFFGLVKLIYDYVKLKQSAQQLTIQKQEAELNYLKSQTNPHFLFNTLNNIYSLAREKSDLAAESVMRLSKILRFMLYEASGEFISIEQELKILNDYIELEKLRYDDSLRINFNHNVEDVKQSIPPLLLMPLVENAFKHGVSETRTDPFIDIHLSVNNRLLSFVIKNSATNAEGDGVVENIGLRNLRRQLELLYGEYELTTKFEENTFKASLKVNLASHV